MAGAIVGAQDKPKRIYLSPKSNITTAQISEGFAKYCSNVVVTQNEDKPDYVLEAADDVQPLALYADEPTNRDGGVLLTTHPQKCATLVSTNAIESMRRSGRVVECGGLENR